jgi:hypothetical protein
MAKNPQKQLPEFHLLEIREVESYMKDIITFNKLLEFDSKKIGLIETDGFIWDTNNSIFAVRLGIEVKYKLDEIDETILSLTSLTLFKIERLEELLNPNPEFAIDILNGGLMPILYGIAYSTHRGLYHAKIRSYPYKIEDLPVISPIKVLGTMKRVSDESSLYKDFVFTG